MGTPLTKNDLAVYVSLLTRQKIAFNYLLNSSCMGNREWGRRWQKKLMRLLESLDSMGVRRLTVSTPYLLERVKATFPEFYVKIGVYAQIDTPRRARGCEFLDRPDADPRLVEQGYKFMKVVNRIGGGTRVVRRFLAQELCGSTNGDTVTVLDIGAGDCDIPLAVTRWADKRGLKVQFTCLDQNPKAIELAERASARRVWWALAHQTGFGGASPTLQVVKTVQADVFTYQPAGGFDYAVGSMTFHHFTNDEIDRLITHLRGFVRKALLINDLHRCLPNYIACFLLAVPLDREIRHDGLLSIRRGFKPRDLARMLAKHDPGPVVRRMWFCRVASIVRFDRELHV